MGQLFEITELSLLLTILVQVSEQRTQNTINVNTIALMHSHTQFKKKVSPKFIIMKASLDFPSLMSPSTKV